MSLTDTNIISGFKEGDRKSEDHIFNLLHKPLFYFANNLIDSPEEARDIVIDSFVKLWEMRDRFADLNNARAFLYVATRNACFDFLRNNKKVTSYKKELLYLSDETVPEDEISRIELQARLIQALKEEIENLPKKCRAIFKMIHDENLSTAEIAERLRLSKKTVLAQKARAISLLKTAFLKRKLLVFCSCVLARYLM
jgi:RNA polymerase sigma-70 factor (ECF subfamily)